MAQKLTVFRSYETRCFAEGQKCVTGKNLQAKYENSKQVKKKKKSVISPRDCIVNAHGYSLFQWGDTKTSLDLAFSKEADIQ